jgi:hypothetical protein
MQITEIPDWWVIVQIPYGYKVFASWNASGLSGDRWRLNSGIKHVTSDPEFYYFHGYSGSVYQCNRLGYGVSSVWTGSVLDGMVDASGGMMEVLGDDRDWTELNVR